MKTIKKIALISLIALPLSGCWTTSEGYKVGKLVKVSKSGLFWGTYEAEIVRGGFEDGTGANGRAFDFSLGVFRNSLVDKAEKLMNEGHTVQLKYQCEFFVAPWRGGHACFATDIQVKK